jgi:hypothetical protein
MATLAVLIRRVRLEVGEYSARRFRGPGLQCVAGRRRWMGADEDRMAELDTAVREYLGWSDVLAKQDDSVVQQQRQA